MSRSKGYAFCPDCNKPMYVEKVHNGIAYVWHGVHCGWGQDCFGEDDVFDTIEDLNNSRSVHPNQQTWPYEGMFNEYGNWDSSDNFIL